MIIEEFVKEVWLEDIGRGDLYAQVADCVPISGKIVAKSDGILAGVKYANVLPKLSFFTLTWNFKDSDKFKKGDILAVFNGDSHTVLSMERTLLNMVLHASSIATRTNEYLELIKAYPVKLLDTRKTRPLLRNFEKYATRMGGAINHRLGLDDSLMLKDTHLKTISNLKEYIKKARQNIPFTAKIEVECESFDEVKIAMDAEVDIIMCDNMKPEDLSQIVYFRDKNYPSILLEASGNINKENIKDYAKTGIDAISSGSLIHQSQWIDLSMKFD
jgi:nicotinate-nucleotide pyrophosphorylase (carboxylating)